MEFIHLSVMSGSDVKNLTSAFLRQTHPHKFFTSDFLRQIFYVRLRRGGSDVKILT